MGECFGALGFHCVRFRGEGCRTESGLSTKLLVGVRVSRVNFSSGVEFWLSPVLGMVGMQVLPWDLGGEIHSWELWSCCGREASKAGLGLR